AEDGIRDFHVTGVQTCALPISALRRARTGAYTGGRICSGFARCDGLNLLQRALPFGEAVVARRDQFFLRNIDGVDFTVDFARPRSEERRVGKECRSGWWSVLEK